MVLIEMLTQGVKQPGWGSLMAALAVFSGAQLLMLGIIGEYVGRTFLTVSSKPQSIVRTLLVHNGFESTTAGRAHTHAPAWHN
jgi:hypothetical protein